MRSGETSHLNSCNQHGPYFRDSKQQDRPALPTVTAAAFTVILLTLNLGCGNSNPIPQHVAPHTLTASAPSPKPSPSVVFGVNGHPFTQPVYAGASGISFATQIKLIKEAGLQYYRFDLPLPAVPSRARRVKQAPPPPPNHARPPQKGCQDYVETDTTELDDLVQIATSCDINPLPVLIPAVNRSTDSLSQLYSASFIQAFNIVSRYKSVIHVWELSNEEDVYSIMKFGPEGSNGVYPAPPGNLATEYYPPSLAISEAILRGLADGARAADPSCQRIVNFGWIHSGFIQNLVNDGVPFDIVGVHWYADATLPGGMGDITCPGQLYPCPAHPALFNLVERLQQITNNKPIWLTENGYQGNVNSPESENLALEDAYLPFVMQLYMNHPETYPFPVVLIYELLDEDVFASTQAGLFWDTTLSNGQIKLVGPKPVYQSIQNLLLPN